MVKITPPLPLWAGLSSPASHCHNFSAGLESPAHKTASNFGRSARMLVMFLSLIACSLALCASATEISPFAPNEAELWQKILDRNKPGSTIKDFKYIEGVPNICLIESMTPQSTAVGNILCFLSSRTNNALCCFSECKEDIRYLERFMQEVGWPGTNAIPQKTAALLMEQIEKRHKRMAKEELDAAKYFYLVGSKYAKERKVKMVMFSRGVYRSALLGRYIGETRNIDGIKKGLIRFAEERDFRLEMQTKVNPDVAFWGLQLANGTPIFSIIGKDQYCTVVGYFADNDDKYLILHDPCTAEQKYSLTDYGGLHLKDAKGQLTDKIQNGVHIFPLGASNRTLTALVIVKWTREDDTAKEILSKEARRLTK
ncbi:MAG: hypothetical protein NTY53_10210 [Kiritimatiellaeota bacterium]|nr:hypothetical protein [Kiritimatiellota bacterium]